MLTETIASGRGSRPNSDVQNVTGVPPISFADFARRTDSASGLTGQALQGASACRIEARDLPGEVAECHVAVLSD